MALMRRTANGVFVGLDLSLTGTGVVVLDNECSVLCAETLKNKLRGMERLAYLREEIHSVVRKYPSAVYCIEGYAMGSRSGQAFSIGELGGVIKLLLHTENIIPHLVPPTRLKKFIVGGGRAEKDMILMKVFQRWGWEAKDNNQADAYGLARIAYGLTNPDGHNKAQIEVLNDILNPPEPKKKK